MRIEGKDRAMSNDRPEPMRVYGVDMGVPLDALRVLIVDDHQFHRNLLAKFLSWGGVANIAYAVDGLDALEQLETFRPDLVLLDVMMPRLDGVEVCRRIRAHPSFSDVPVLFQTALNADQQRVAYFQAGATDVIGKPINPGELIARVRLHLERRMLLGELTSYRSRVQQELRMAQNMQMSLIATPEEVAETAAASGLMVESSFESSSELGGDFWKMFDLGEGRLGLLTVDFSGHGVPAAINTFRLHMLLERMPPAPGGSPARWLESLNRALCAVLPVGQFATAIYAVLEPRRGRVTLACAGAPNPLLILGGETFSIDASGLFLGIEPSIDYRDQEYPLPAGASLFVFSDAMVEARAEDGALFGSTRLEALAYAAHRQSPPGERLKYLLKGFYKFCPPPLNDDLTAVWVTRAAA